MVNIFDIPEKLYNLHLENMPGTNSSTLDKNIDDVEFLFFKTNGGSFDIITYNNIKFTSIDRTFMYSSYLLIIALIIYVMVSFFMYVLHLK